MQRIIFMIILLPMNASALVAPLDFNVLAAGESKSSQHELYAAAREYIQKSTTEEDQSAWVNKWKERIAGAEANDEPEDKFTQRILQTFVEDNQKLFTAPENSEKQKLLECARLYCVCIDRGVTLPSRLADRITPELVHKIIEFLRR